MLVGDRETVIEHDGNRATWTVSTSEKIWVNRLAKLAKEHPESVARVDENDDGCVCYHVPLAWVSIRPPRKNNLSEEQKAALRERFQAAREKINQIGEFPSRGVE